MQGPQIHRSHRNKSMAPDPAEVHVDDPNRSVESNQSSRRWLWKVGLALIGAAVVIWLLTNSRIDYNVLWTQVVGEQSWIATTAPNTQGEYVEPEEKAVTLGFNKQINANLVLVSKKYGTMTKYDLYVLDRTQQRFMLDFVDVIVDNGVARHEDGFVSSCDFMTDYQPLEMELIVSDFRSKLIKLITPRLSQLEEFKKQRGLVRDNSK